MDDWREKLLMASLFGTIWIILTLLGLGKFLGWIISIISSLILTNIYSNYRCKREAHEATLRQLQLKRFSEEDSTLFEMCKEKASKNSRNNWGMVDWDRREKLIIRYYTEEKRKQETERLLILNEKTRQIQKENEYIGQDYVRWNELNAQSSVTTKTLHLCKKLLTLLGEVADDCDILSAINEQLQHYEEIALEKQAIIDRVEKVAALYNDIGNPQEANKLKEKFGL